MKNSIIPEHVFLKSIKSAFDFIREDFEEKEQQGKEKESYLYLICENQGVERYNYFEQAKDLLLRDNFENRKLNVDLMYNMDFDNVPSVYISLSGEQHGENNISVEQENKDVYIDDDKLALNVFTRRKNANYSIYIVSDNSNEANLIYYILDCIFISLTSHFAYVGIYNMTQGGQDIQIENDKIPKHIFVKTLSLGLQYCRSAPSFYEIPLFNNIFFKGRPTGLKSDPNDTPNNLDDL